MCRLALFNKIFALENLETIASLFWDLETELGGDGNGVATVLADGTFLIEKGVHFNPYDAYKQIGKWLECVDSEWFVFHTRMATSGGKTDVMCHPHVEANVLLAHNGIAGNFAGYKLLGKEVSDSRFLLHVALNYTSDFLHTLQGSSGVFVGFVDTVPYVVKASAHSDLRLLKSEAGGLCFVSKWPYDIPAKYGLYNVTAGNWLGTDPDIVIQGPAIETDLKKYLSVGEYMTLRPKDAARYVRVSSTKKSGEPLAYYMLVSWTDYNVKEKHDV